MESDTQQLSQIVAEVVDNNARVADNGRILDPHGRAVKNYSDVGLPAFLEFTLPPGSGYFTLDVNGRQIHQSVTDIPVVLTPPSPPPAPPRPVTITPSALSQVAPAVPVAKPVAPPPAVAPPVPIAQPVAPAAAKKEPEKPQEVKDDEVHDIDIGDLSKTIDLEFIETPKDVDLELEKPEEKKDDVNF